MVSTHATEERNYQPLWFGNRMLTSAKHVVYSMTTDEIYEEHESDWSQVAPN